MGKVWVLDTSTKGTGASMVPLDRVLRKPSGDAEPVFVPPPRRPGPEPVSQPAAPRLFKVMDVSTRQILADGVRARDALDVLSDVRSIVDVNVYVWQPQTEKWRLLSLDEQRVLWEARSPAAAT